MTTDHSNGSTTQPPVEAGLVDSETIDHIKVPNEATEGHQEPANDGTMQNRPGAGDFAMKTDSTPPVDQAAALITIDPDREAFLSNALRTNAGTMADIVPEVRAHGMAQYRGMGEINKLALFELKRVLRTAEDGRSRNDYKAVIGGRIQSALSGASRALQGMSGIGGGFGNPNSNNNPPR